MKQKRLHAPVWTTIMKPTLMFNLELFGLTKDGQSEKHLFDNFDLAHLRWHIANNIEQQFGTHCCGF